MNLCDSCKKWEGCEWKGVPQVTPQRHITGFGACHGCDCHAPITRADLAARDVEIAQLSEARRVVPDGAAIRAEWVAALDCPRVEQSILHVPGVSRGNCFSATLAGLLKLPIEAIPKFATYDHISWQEQVNVWLQQFGLAWFPMAGDDLAGECQQLGITGLWSEMSGKSPRFDVGHSCVAKDGRLAWDPHPEQTGLDRPIWWHGVFLALRPWEAVSRIQPIPAARVLKDGEVGVDRKEWQEPTVEDATELFAILADSPTWEAAIPGLVEWIKEKCVSPKEIVIGRGMVPVGRDYLRVIEQAVLDGKRCMDYLGEQLNNMEAVDSDDIATVTPWFEAVNHAVERIDALRTAQAKGVEG